MKPTGDLVPVGPDYIALLAKFRALEDAVDHLLCAVTMDWEGDQVSRLEELTEMLLTQGSIERGAVFSKTDELEDPE